MTVASAAGPRSSLQMLIDDAPITAIQIRVLLLCTLVAVIEGIDLNVIPLVAPLIAETWEVPTSAFGAIFASGPVGLIIGGLLMGQFADRWGRRTGLIVTMILMTGSTVATAFAHNVTELLIWRIIAGVAFGGIIPASMSLVSEFLPTRMRASVVAFVILGQSLGGLLAAVSIGLVLEHQGWQTIILDVGAICAVMTLLLVVILPESPRYLLLRKADSARLHATVRSLRLAEMPTAATNDEGEGQQGRLKDLFTGGRALGTCLLWMTFIGACAGVSFFMSWLTLIYTYAGKPAAVGVHATAMYNFGGIAGGLILPLFCRRLNVNLVLMVTLIVGAACSAALGSVLSLGNPVNLALACACGIFIPGAYYLLYPPAVGFYPTAIRSTGVGAAVAFGRIGNMVSPMAAGMILSAGFGPSLVFWAMAGPLLVSAVAIAAFHRLARGTAVRVAAPIATI